MLFRFSDTQNRNALEVSERELQVAEAKWRQVTQSALIDPQAKRELAITEAEYRLKQAERDYAKDLLAKSTVRAPKAGLALFSDKRDFVGRPVQAGQRVMEIADPATAELKINVPVEDAIVLGRGARVRVFLDSDPLHAVDANLLRASFAAKIIEGNVLAFRVDAAFKPGQTPLPRLGIRGTAQMLGRDVPLFVLLFRRPI